MYSVLYFRGQHLWIFFYLYTLQDLAYITQRPQTYVPHGKSRLVIAIGISSDLILFIIHETLNYQTVAPDHVHWCILVRIKACCKHGTEDVSSIFKKLSLVYSSYRVLAMHFFTSLTKRNITIWQCNMCSFPKEIQFKCHTADSMTCMWTFR